MKLHIKTLEKLRNLINEETEYRTGPMLISFFKEFGFNDNYGSGFPSRWMYTDSKLSSLNDNGKIEDCILKLLSPENFIGRFNVLDKFITDLNEFLSFEGYKIVYVGKSIIINQLNENTLDINESVLSEDEFLKREFNEISLDNIGLDSVISDILKSRFEEIRKCLAAKASLSVIFLIGSTLEGLLLGVALKFPQEYNRSSFAPKNKEGKVLVFHKWTLNNLIEVSYDVGKLKEDVKKFSNALRDFRNYIHPFEQVNSKFYPNEHTANICWQVLKAAIYQLSNN